MSIIDKMKTQKPMYLVWVKSTPDKKGNDIIYGAWVFDTEKEAVNFLDKVWDYSDRLAGKNKLVFESEVIGARKFKKAKSAYKNFRFMKKYLDDINKDLKRNNII